MRKALLFSLSILLLTIALPKTAFPQAKPEAGEQCKISWEPSFESARARAQQEGKPILLLHLFGRLDEEMA
jgi:hypothetical protein